jgi:hypothetical protein
VMLALFLNFLEVALRKGFFERLAAWLNRWQVSNWRRKDAVGSFTGH